MKAFRREMDQGYWDSMAKDYEDEIFSVLHSDRRGLIRKRLKRIASKKNAVLDLGCGIGHFLPTLANHFGWVYANDISKELLDRAIRHHGRHSNITFLHGDIRAAFKKLPKVDCVVSVNSLISSSIGIRRLMLDAASKVLKPGGHLVLVVPSLESSLFVDVRFAQWKWKGGMDPAKAVRSVYPRAPEADNKARQGVIPIDGVATKHFLEEELHLLLSDVAMDMLECVKIEYKWHTELEHPPRWMQEPYPWDWLVVAKRRKKGRSAA